MGHVSSTHEPPAVHYNRCATEMENLPWFYEWVMGCIERFRVRPDAAILDLGCGPGALLERLAQRGYTNLTGLDFAEASLAMACSRVPAAQLVLQDIQEAPPPATFDLIVMTTVLDFLPRPLEALANARLALRRGGLLLLTIRNPLAYWPLYHARGLARLLEGRPRARHWFLHLTTPLGLRRSDQPYERLYTTGDARRLMNQAGLQVVAEDGFQLLPMLWIPDLPWLVDPVRRLDQVTRGLLPHRLRYFVMLAGSPL